jgi:hypothetical protein
VRTVGFGEDPNLVVGGRALAAQEPKTFFQAALVFGLVFSARSAPRSGLRALTRSRRVREFLARKECFHLLLLEARMVDVYQAF